MFRTFRPPVLVCLSITQLISWGTLYYAFSVLVVPITKSLQWPVDQAVGAFSVALFLAAGSAIPAGLWIERSNGRRVLATGSLLSTLAFLILASAHSLPVFYAGWALAGVSISLSLYEAAFGVMAGLFDTGYRRAVAIVTLAGGLASSVFWPLTEILVRYLDWRATLVVFAATHLLVCWPLHAFALPETRKHIGNTDKPPRPPLGTIVRQRRFGFIALTYMLNSVVASVVSVHAVSYMLTRGTSLKEAAWIASVAGPMQVAGRLLEFNFGHAWKASRTGIWTLSCSALSVFVLMLAGSPPALLAGMVLYGASNGIVTILRTTTIVEVFGREQYAAVSGAVMTPTLLARAAGPMMASILLVRTGSYAVVLGTVAGIALLALGAFVMATRGIHPAEPSTHS